MLVYGGWVAVSTVDAVMALTRALACALFHRALACALSLSHRALAFLRALSLPSCPRLRARSLSPIAPFPPVPALLCVAQAAAVAARGVQPAGAHGVRNLWRQRSRRVLQPRGGHMGHCRPERAAHVHHPHPPTHTPPLPPPPPPTQGRRNRTASPAPRMPWRRQRRLCQFRG